MNNEREYIEPPRDADGKTWHVGDIADRWGEVKMVSYDGDAWYLAWGDVNGPWVLAERLHHHKTPTVESVLAQFAGKLLELHDDCDPSASANDEAALVAEFAERLRELTKDAKGLVAENAMLRDLVRDMYTECGRGMGYEHPTMRELGIDEE